MRHHDGPLWSVVCVVPAVQVMQTLFYVVCVWLNMFQCACVFQYVFCVERVYSPFCQPYGYPFCSYNMWVPSFLMQHVGALIPHATCGCLYPTLHTIYYSCIQERILHSLGIGTYMQLRTVVTFLHVPRQCGSSCVYTFCIHMCCSPAGTPDPLAGTPDTHAESSFEREEIHTAHPLLVLPSSCFALFLFHHELLLLLHSLHTKRATHAATRLHTHGAPP